MGPGVRPATPAAPSNASIVLSRHLGRCAAIARLTAPRCPAGWFTPIWTHRLHGRPLAGSHAHRGGGPSRGRPAGAPPRGTHRRPPRAGGSGSARAGCQARRRAAGRAAVARHRARRRLRLRGEAAPPDGRVFHSATSRHDFGPDNSFLTLRLRLESTSRRHHSALAHSEPRGGSC